MNFVLWTFTLSLLISPLSMVAVASTCAVFLGAGAGKQKNPALLTNPKDLWAEEGELLRSLSPEERLRMPFKRLEPVLDEIQQRDPSPETTEMITRWKNEGYEYELALDIVTNYIAKMQGFSDGTWNWLKIWVKEGFLVVPTFANLSPRTIARMSPYPIFPIGLKDASYAVHDRGHAEALYKAWKQASRNELSYESIATASRYMEGLLERLDIESQRVSNLTPFEQKRWENQKTFIYDLLFVLTHEQGFKLEKNVLKNFVDRFSADRLSAYGNDIVSIRLFEVLRDGQMTEGTTPPHWEELLRLTESERREFIGEAVGWLKADLEKHWPKNWLRRLLEF